MRRGATFLEVLIAGVLATILGLSAATLTGLA